MQPVEMSSPLVLYDLVEKKVVVSFNKGILGPPEFNQFYEILIQDITENGVRVPEGVRRSYDGKVIIRIEDKNFGRAFFDFYVPENLLGSKRYAWQKVGK